MCAVPLLLFNDSIYVFPRFIIYVFPRLIIYIFPRPIIYVFSRLITYIFPPRLIFCMRSRTQGQPLTRFADPRLRRRSRTGT